MKPKPKNIKDLNAHVNAPSVDLLNFLKKHWVGLDGVKPKDYDEFCKNYDDFDGMLEWTDNERGKQEDEFKGFDDGDDCINFVSTVALPYVAYDDIGQGRAPIQTLIHACISYGLERGRIYGMQEGSCKERRNIGDAIENIIIKREHESLQNRT